MKLLIMQSSPASQQFLLFKSNDGGYIVPVLTKYHDMKAH